MGAIYGSSYYTIVNGPSWTDAENAAKSLGGHLATINNSDENTYVLNHIDKSTKDTNRGGAWIGLNADLDGKWSWSSGENYSYSNWVSGQGLITDYRPHIGNSNSVEGPYVHMIGSSSKQVGFLAEEAGNGMICPRI